MFHELPQRKQFGCQFWFIGRILFCISKNETFAVRAILDNHCVQINEHDTLLCWAQGLTAESLGTLQPAAAPSVADALTMKRTGVGDGRVFAARARTMDTHPCRNFPEEMRYGTLSPLGPGGPTGPGSPFSPFAPCGPGSPFSPLGPESPA